MKLWLLGRIWDKGPYMDYNNGFVIRAQTEQIARILASREAADEGPEMWLLNTHSYCVEIPVWGNEEVILKDFNAG